MRINPIEIELFFIPMSITLLRNLEGIGLGHNNIEEFPSFLTQLPKLRTIMLNYNRITELPVEIGQMRQLRVLGLDGNRLTALPAEIGLLRNLQVLGLAKNQLATLPPSFVGLQGLQQLGLANNQFNRIPSELFDIAKIRAIGLANNNISVFPEGIGRLTRLDKLNLKGNPLDPRFIELAGRGSRAVLAFIADQKKHKQRLLNQIIRGKKEAQDRINIRGRLANLLKPKKLVCEVCNGNKRVDGYDVHLKTHFNKSVCYGCQGKGVPDETTEELHEIIENCNKYKENYREQIIRQAEDVKDFQSRIPTAGHHSDILFQETP